MATTTAAPPSRVPPLHAPRPGGLALALQEVFTAVVRLRANRQSVPDAPSFRTHIKQLVSRASQEAAAAGTDRESVKLAVHALIAFVDESVLNSPTMSADWARQTLQEEVFGEHRAGETFFHHLADLLARQDSHEVADVLEVYCLCMRLGFRGRYGAGDAGELLYLLGQAEQKIVRIRGGWPELSPLWAPPDESAPPERDPWLLRLAIGALAVLGATLVLFLAYSIALRGRVADVQDLVRQLVP